MYAFERVGFEDERAADSDASSGDELTAEEVSQQLADFLTELKLCGKLSAKDVCTIGYYAKLAGIGGATAAFAYNLNAASEGHYNRHFKAVLKLDEEVAGAYKLRVPGHDKHSTDRIQHVVPVLPAHESLSEELAETPGLSMRLRRACVDKEWSAAYFQNPVVTSAPPNTDVWPLALYLDAVPITKRDAVIGWWVYNLATEKRHLIVTLRKSQLCQCGCQGWCSLHNTWSFLAWTFGALAEGKWPNRRHDNSDFLPDEAWRAVRSGNDMMRGVLIHLKGDWAEIVHSWGFVMWSHISNPCFCCWSRKETLYQVGETSPISGPFPPKTPQHYEQACADCERVVLVPDAMTHARLIGALWYDMKKGGSHGRSLRRDFPPLALLAGDRLEPSHLLMDVAELETLTPPFQLLFWRTANETLCKHRCALFNVHGVSLYNLSLDVLHTMNLGVYKSYCITGIWACLENDAWETGAQTTDVRISLGVARLRENLNAWYEIKHRERPHDSLHRLNDLTAKMLGTTTKPSLATKAAETATLVEFVRDMCREHQAKLGDQGEALKSLGDVLVELRELIKNSPRNLSESATQLLVDLAKRAFVLREHARVPATPKWHLMLHIASRARHDGNPSWYATFHDESLNGMLAAMAKRCHRRTWHNSLLAAFRWVSAGATRRVRPRHG